MLGKPLLSSKMWFSANILDMYPIDEAFFKRLIHSALFPGRYELMFKLECFWTESIRPRTMEKGLNEGL